MLKAITTFVQKPNLGRRFAISDIHGCSKTFKALLKKIKLQKEDQLFLVGDMVNRGPKSDKVLNKILKLKQSGHQVFFIRGNHEQTILNTLKKSNGQRKRVLKGHHSLCLLKNGKIDAKYISLLEDSFHYIELDDYWLVHAGFNTKAKEPLLDTFSMLNIRDFEIKRNFLKMKTVVFGHTPQSLATIEKSIKKESKKICIDNGCVNHRTKHQGSLVCMELNSKRLFIQKNLDYAQ